METKKIDFQPRLKIFYLNLIFNCNSDKKDGGNEVDQEDTDDFVTKKYVFEMLKVQEFLFRNLFDSMHSNVNSRIDGMIKDLTELKPSLQFLQNDIDDRKKLLSKLRQAVFKALMTQHF